MYWTDLLFQNSQFLGRDVGGLPTEFHSTDGLASALRQVINDSFDRTGSYDEVSEVLAEILRQNETRSANFRKVLNGKFLIFD